MLATTVVTIIEQNRVFDLASCSLVDEYPRQLPGLAVLNLKLARLIIFNTE